MSISSSPAHTVGCARRTGITAAGLLGIALPWALLLAAAGTLLWKRSDRNLVAMWALQLAGFLVLAGPRGMIPGQERFAIGLIAPAVVLWARGAGGLVVSASGTLDYLPGGPCRCLVPPGRLSATYLPLHRADGRTDP